MNRPRLIAALSTVVFHIAVVLLLLVIYLRFSPVELEERTWPPVDESELLFGGEYVMLGDNLSDPDMSEASGEEDASVSEPGAPGLQNDGAGIPDEAAVVSSDRESPVKVKPAPEVPSGPTREEQLAEEQRRREQEASERISSRVKFGKGASDGSNGKAGSTAGNASQGALSGAPGTDLRGRTLASWSKPAASATGTIVVQVHVNRKGRVTRASYLSGTGAVAGNAAARRSCEQAALRSSFSVADNAPVDQVGRITYRFE